MTACEDFHTNAIPSTSCTPMPTGILQRKCDCGQQTIAGGECSACNKERKSTLRRSAIGHDSGNSLGSAVPSIVNEVLNSPGQPLDAETRAFMEPRFGRDFSRVRLHSDAKAAQSAQAVNALAYTVGNDIVFGSRQLVSDSQPHQFVLAHELAHVIQQADAPQGGSLRIAPTNDPAEVAADNAARDALANNQPRPQRGAGRYLQRLGANAGCTTAQAAAIHQAIFDANSWVGKAVRALAASPLTRRTLTALTHNFGAAGTAANAPAISAVLSAGRTDMNRNPYSCAGAADATCSSSPCGYTTAAGVHASVICTNTSTLTDPVIRAGCVLHEAIHASDATMTADDYSGWFGHSGSTAGYPGATPLTNADSYTTLAMELS